MIPNSPEGLLNALGRQAASNPTILDKARDAVYGDRERDYGPALPDMSRTAQMWSAILGTKVEPEQVTLCMVALKISRLVHAYKEDSIVDIAGWAAVLEKVVKETAYRDLAAKNADDILDSIRMGK